RGARRADGRRERRRAHRPRARRAAAGPGRRRTAARAGPSRMSAASPRLGTVALVGAGPGAPGLITVDGVRRLEQADVVIYDYLASPRLLDHAPAHAERILVGKHGGGQRVEQGVITELML